MMSEKEAMESNDNHSIDIEKLGMWLCDRYEDVRNLSIHHPNYFKRIMSAYKADFERADLDRETIFKAFTRCLNDTKRERKRYAPNFTELLVYVNIDRNTYSKTQNLSKTVLQELKKEAFDAITKQYNGDFRKANEALINWEISLRIENHPISDLDIYKKIMLALNEK